MDKQNEKANKNGMIELTLDQMDKVFGGVQTIRYDAANYVNVRTGPGSNYTSQNSEQHQPFTPGQTAYDFEDLRPSL